MRRRLVCRLVVALEKEPRTCACERLAFKVRGNRVWRAVRYFLCHLDLVCYSLNHWQCKKSIFSHECKTQGTELFLLAFGQGERWELAIH